MIMITPLSTRPTKRGKSNPRWNDHSLEARLGARAAEPRAPPDAPPPQAHPLDMIYIIFFLAAALGVPLHPDDKALHTKTEEDAAHVHTCTGPLCTGYSGSYSC